MQLRVLGLAPVRGNSGAVWLGVMPLLTVGSLLQTDFLIMAPAPFRWIITIIAARIVTESVCGIYVGSL